MIIAPSGPSPLVVPSASPEMDASRAPAHDAPSLGSAEGVGASLGLLNSAHVGLAMYDEELRLLACNEPYRLLRGHSADEVVAGARLPDLVRRVLERLGMAGDEIDVRVAKIMERLTPGAESAFRYVGHDAKLIEMHRCCLPSGAVVESVRELGAAASISDLNVQFAQIAANARQRLTHALDVMAEGFALFDGAGRLVIFNCKYVECRSSVADLIKRGAEYETLLAEEIRRGAFDLEGTTAEAFFKARLDQHTAPGVAQEVRLADGRWHLINEMGTSDGGRVQTRSDITQMKAREADLMRLTRELHTRNTVLDAILNNMVQGVAMYDRDERLIVCNRRYLELYGMSDQIVRPGAMLADVIEHNASLGNLSKADAERVLSERSQAIKLGTRITFKQRQRDGRVIAVMNEPVPDGGSITTYMDITDSERHAEQMREYTLKLEQSNRELQDFAYVASHDLQEPLRKIEAFGDRLFRRYGKDLPDEGRMFLERMQNASGRMRRLINDLLDYSRITTKAKPFARVAMDEVLAGVLSDLQIRIEETGALITADPLPVIEADATQMRQLLQNVLSNALKFRKPDVRPVISIRCSERESLSLDAHTRYVRLEIRDNGIGFDNKYKEQIFKIFQRLHGRLAYEGTGVGLATIRKIVERHGGTIDADGQPGEGATFIIELPLCQPTSDARSDDN